MIGKTVSHYRILEKLGEGGMGVVYKAEDTKLGRTVALKFLPSELTRDPEARERFIHEAKAASALDHNNICTVHEIGETEDERIFIAMACYEGETLKKKIQHGPLPLDQVISIATQVAQGLAKAHARGIVHRDIKPANIIVTDDGVAKILDFGLAKLAGQARLTKTSSTVGTIAYMSPEQVSGREVDARTDVWSLGVVLYEMVTGQLPFQGEYEPALMYSIMNDKPKLMSSLRDGVPRELERVVERALAKRPGERYSGVAELLVDLNTLSEEQSERSRTRRPEEEQTAEAGQRKKSIAVLPFKSLSDSKKDEYFSDGTTEDIIMQLSKIGGLKVISRTSVMRYKHSEKSIPEIGRELGVATILEGSVRRAGGRVRIVAQLLDVQTDEHLWAETYDRDMKDVFAIQSDVAEKISAALRASLSEAERERIQKKPTGNTEAYNCYLKGRFHWNKRRSGDLETAIKYFREAIALDPGYALAYAGLALTYVMLPAYGELPDKECTSKAEAAARKALELDPTLAEPHAVLGMKAAFEWDWAGAEIEYRRAIELNPTDSTAHHWYSLLLLELDKIEEASAEIKRALELDPLSLIINTAIGAGWHYRRQYDKAAEQFRKILEVDPNFTSALLNLGRTYVQMGRLADAVAEFERDRSIGGSSPYALAWLGYAHARAGNENDARKTLGELIHMFEQGHRVAYQIALVYWGLSDKERALEWLERACEERNRNFSEIGSDAVWDAFRSDSRFAALTKKVGVKH